MVKIVSIFDWRGLEVPAGIGLYIQVSDSWSLYWNETEEDPAEFEHAKI